MWGAMHLRLRFRYIMLPKEGTARGTAEDESHDEEPPSYINIWAHRDR